MNRKRKCQGLSAQQKAERRKKKREEEKKKYKMVIKSDNNKTRLPKPENKARLKVDRAIQKGMHEEQHTSILFGLPSVTPLTACRAALLPVLLQTQ